MTDLSKGPGVERFIAEYQTFLGAAFQLDGMIPLSAMVFATRHHITHESAGPTPRIIAVHPRETPEATEAKNHFVASVREIAALSLAVGVVISCEAWILEGPEVAGVDPLEGIENHPNRSEAIYCILDHLAFPHTRTWMAKIRRPANTLAPFRENPHDVTSGGRFTEAFPRELWS